mmetsp:Transcript_73160/g.176528  ORF Transcript_73160/g.176528 Transcript_73160/m.176528 type:complete len:219 (-) Transcript_73160:183-839(-)
MTSSRGIGLRVQSGSESAARATSRASSSRPSECSMRAWKPIGWPHATSSWLDRSQAMRAACSEPEARCLRASRSYEEANGPTRVSSSPSSPPGALAAASGSHALQTCSASVARSALSAASLVSARMASRWTYWSARSASRSSCVPLVRTTGSCPSVFSPGQRSRPVTSPSTVDLVSGTRRGWSAASEPGAKTSSPRETSSPTRPPSSAGGLTHATSVR